MLKSFSFMPEEVDIAFYYDIQNEIEGLRHYFYKFAKWNADEAIQRAIMHAVNHFRPDKGSLRSYLKKLAREIVKENGKIIAVDFLEQTLSQDDTDGFAGSSPVVDLGRVSDFVNDIITDIELSVDRSVEVEVLALEFMDKFVMLCEALLTYDTQTKYYPDVFVRQCFLIRGRCGDCFNDICIDLYLRYKDKFKWFLSLPEKTEGSWKESDFGLINRSIARKLTFVSPVTGEEIEDADIDEFTIKGVLEKNRRIYRIRYYDIWEKMCDMIDEDGINEMKFKIGDNFVIRTFAGSWSVINPDYFNEYDIVRAEIITNILSDTTGRLINAGSECIYIIYNPIYPIKESKRTVFGHNIDFVYEDITDTIINSQQ